MLVISRLDSCNSLLCGFLNTLSKQLQRVQNSCARLIMMRPKRDHVTPLLKELPCLRSEGFAQFVRSAYVCAFPPIVQAVKHETLTQCWAINVDPPSVWLCCWRGDIFSFLFTKKLDPSSLGWVGCDELLSCANV